MTRLSKIVAREPLRAYPDIETAWRRLAAYLGPKFRPELTDYGVCCAFVEEEFSRLGPEEFYQHSHGYLYDLTHFHFSPYKDPFFATLTRFAEAHGLRDLADAGCGVGLDAQALMAAGYAVTLYDVDCPSLRYARWRLEQDRDAQVVTRSLDALGSARHDLAYAVDVLEHVPEPAAFIARLFTAADHVVVNLFEHDLGPWDGRDMHFPLNHWTLLPLLGRYGELVQVGISGATAVTAWRGRKP